MALTSLTSLLLLSMFVFASAIDYSYNTQLNFERTYNQESNGRSYGGEANHHQSIEGEMSYHQKEFSGYGTKAVSSNSPKSEEEEKTYNEESSGYGYGSNIGVVSNKQKLGDIEKPYREDTNDGYSHGKVKSAEKERPNYENSKSVDNGYGYGPTPSTYKQKSENQEKHTLAIGIEGVIMCKSGPKYVPIKGARARITCVAVHESGGYEKAPFSIMSGETDAKGYFLATLSPELIKHKYSKLTQCKTFLEKSPLESCQVKTDVNRGKSGAFLSSYKILHHNNIKLYTVGPFFYTSQPNSVPTTGY